LAKGATPVDFAYSIHTEVGNRCVGARVNEKIVPLDYPLQNGDVTEILTNKNSTPNQFWLNFLVTSQAKQRVKAWFRSQDTDKLVKSGKELLNKQLKRLGHNELDPHLTLLKNYEKQKLTYKERENVLEKIGNGSLASLLVVKRLFPNDQLLSIKPTKKGKTYELKKAEHPKVMVSGEDLYETKLASCCKPSPRDSIVGYVTRGNYISVHSIHCKTLARLLHKERLIKVHWSTEKPKHRVKLLLKIFDRVGMIRDIANMFSMHSVNIKSMVVGEERMASGLHEMIFVVEVEDVDRLDHIANRLESIEGVQSVTRVIEIQNDKKNA